LIIFNSQPDSKHKQTPNGGNKIKIIHMT